MIISSTLSSELDLVSIRCVITFGRLLHENGEVKLQMNSHAGSHTHQQKGVEANQSLRVMGKQKNISAEEQWLRGGESQVPSFLGTECQGETTVQCRIQ